MIPLLQSCQGSMTSQASFHTPEQISTWLRGLFTIAWADGQFDVREQESIQQLVQEELAPGLTLESLEPLSEGELVAGLGNDPGVVENFLRTAVMVAVADGTYSVPEDQLIRKFSSALGYQDTTLEALRLTRVDSHSESMIPFGKEQAAVPLHMLKPVRQWLDQTEIRDPRVARFLCKMIPSHCPFERDVNLFGHKVVHIPPMCKINPLYEQLVGLRFRALSYLADECGEDVSAYC